MSKLFVKINAAALDLITRRSRRAGNCLLAYTLIRLRCYRCHSDTVAMSDGELADQMGVSRPHVVECRRELVDMGLIRFSSGVKAGGNRSNCYQMLPIPVTPPCKPGLQPLPTTFTTLVNDVYNPCKPGLQDVSTTFTTLVNDVDNIRNKENSKERSNKEGEDFNPEISVAEAAAISDALRASGIGMPTRAELTAALVAAGHTVADIKNALTLAAGIIARGECRDASPADPAYLKAKALARLTIGILRNQTQSVGI